MGSEEVAKIDENHMDKQLEDQLMDCRVELEEEKQGIGKKVLSKINSLPLPLKVLAWLVFAPNGFNFFLVFLATKYITPIIAKATFLRSPLFLLSLKTTGALGLAFLLKKFVFDKLNLPQKLSRK